VEGLFPRLEYWNRSWGFWNYPSYNDGGATWVVQASATTKLLRAVSFADAMTGLAVGDSGTIVRTTNAVYLGKPEIAETTNYLEGISFVDLNTATIVGQSGVILRTNNGGNTWFAKQAQQPTICTVSLCQSKYCITAGVAGKILYTTNGGSS